MQVILIKSDIGNFYLDEWNETRCEKRDATKKDGFS